MVWVGKGGGWVRDGGKRGCIWCVFFWFCIVVVVVVVFRVPSLFPTKKNKARWCGKRDAKNDPTFPGLLGSIASNRRRLPNIRFPHVVVVVVVDCLGC